MYDIILLGLPGLYQNWILCSIDSTSTYENKNTNFYTNSSKIRWYGKLETDITSLDSSKIIINTYVKSYNFVWYLYNFLEKTDDIGISVDNLVCDMFTKAKGTQAFNQMLSHLIKSYNLQDNMDNNYYNNSAIEYFYYSLIQKHHFKDIAGFTNPQFINIEYKDFSDVISLKNKLLHLKIFNELHFTNLYNKLTYTNFRYLNKHTIFISKLKNNQFNFDILEEAYIGFLLYDYNSKILDWFNKNKREKYINDNYTLICSQAEKFF